MPSNLFSFVSWNDVDGLTKKHKQIVFVNSSTMLKPVLQQLCQEFPTIMFASHRCSNNTHMLFYKNTKLRLDLIISFATDFNYIVGKLKDGAKNSQPNDKSSTATIKVDLSPIKSSLSPQHSQSLPITPREDSQQLNKSLTATQQHSQQRPKTAVTSLQKARDQLKQKRKEDSTSLNASSHSIQISVSHHHEEWNTSLSDLQDLLNTSPIKLTDNSGEQTNITDTSGRSSPNNVIEETHIHHNSNHSNDNNSSTIVPSYQEQVLFTLQQIQKQNELFFGQWNQFLKEWTQFIQSKST